MREDVVTVYFRPRVFCFSFGEKSMECGEMLFPVCVAECTASATISYFSSHHLLMSLKGTVTESSYSVGVLTLQRAEQEMVLLLKRFGGIRT